MSDTAAISVIFRLAARGAGEDYAERLALYDALGRLCDRAGMATDSAEFRATASCLRGAETAELRLRERLSPTQPNP